MMFVVYDMQGNKAVACYKTKVVKNQDAIYTIVDISKRNHQEQGC